ncbi:universal stress protein [Flagellimonas meridianipacifica]|uniref:Nucleotide-binding universal stress UspA family protein n=1 Tax=Flagellimonas meridianipacifica TaxID=1080225 RepID=A0A2T0MI25_9FLAO|nr:universal stress protein [Allomuricauda pacifica]PRX57233.1 nucleotide-binding universal stress UspA family protein [Allomuricauda pacifica]
MKQLLMPTDFSENAWNAFFTAIKLYGDFECTFHLLHAYEPKIQNISGFKSSVRTGYSQQSLAEHSKTELAKILSYIKRNHHNTKHHFQTHSIQGELVETIKLQISKLDIDGIIMGTKGASGAKEIFMGSNTVRVLKNIKNCMLLAVPNSFEFKSLETVVFPTEYAHFFPKSILEPLIELMAHWKSEIKIFHVAQEFVLDDIQRSNKQILKQRFSEIPFSFYKEAIKTTVSKAIRDFSKEQGADLIVLTNYKHTFFEQLTQEPIVKKVSFKSEIPLLVLPNFEG